MESTTKQLIASAIGSTSVLKQMQSFFAPDFSNPSSLRGGDESIFLVSTFFWHTRFELFSKPILPDFSSNYFQKIKP